MEMRIKQLSFIIYTITILITLSLHLHAQEEISISDLYDMSLEELINVTITTASKSPQKITEVPSAVTVITRNEIKNWNARTVIDVLRFIPGLYAENYNGNLFTVSARGFYPSGFSKSAFLLLVDGRPTNDIDFGNANFLMTTRNIKQIEIIRGPGSALYGANAFLGVINVITLNANDIASSDKPGIYSDFSFGEHSTFQSGISFGKQYKNEISVYSGLEFSQQDKQVESYYGFGSDYKSAFRKSKNDKYLNIDYFFKASYKNIILSSGAAIQKSQYPLHFGQLYFVDKEESDKLFYFSDITYSGEVYSDLSFQIKSYFNNNHYKEKVQESSTNFIPPDNIVLNVDSLTRPNHLDETRIGLEGQINYDFNFADYTNKIITGIELKNESVEYYHAEITAIPKTYDIKEFSNTTIGFFVQDKIGLHQNLDFYLGGRFDHHSKYGNNFSPRLSTIYKNSGFYARANYSEAFKAPSFHQLYNHKIDANFVAPEDTSALGKLKPEKLKSLDFGAGYSYENLLSADITFYMIEATNELVNTVFLSQANYFYNRKDKISKSLGIEFSTRIDKDFEDFKFSPFLNLSYAQVKRDTSFSNSFFDFKGENHNYGPNLKFVSGFQIIYMRAIYSNFAFHFIPEDKNTNSVGNYADLNIGYRNTSLDFKIGIKNFMNHTYYESQSIQLSRYFWTELNLYID